MDSLDDLGEQLYGCKVCGYIAKSGAGLKGHVQLAHGERSAGKAELRQIGENIAAMHNDIARQLGQLADHDGLNQMVAQLTELNDHLRALRESKEVSQSVVVPTLKPASTPKLTSRRSLSITEGAIIVGLGIAFLSVFMSTKSD